MNKIKKRGGQMKKLFFFDIDGTLIFKGRFKVSDMNFIRKYQKAGYLFGLCTGRPLKETTEILPSDIQPDFYIATSGAVILNKEKHVIYEKIICFEDIHKIYKEYHQKANKWVGYLIKMEGIVYYIAGDTDKTKETSHVECDVAFLPVGGTYTMDYIEAASLTRKIKPKYVIPTHYGSVVGDIECGILFKELINEKETKCELYI